MGGAEGEVAKVGSAGAGFDARSSVWDSQGCRRYAQSSLSRSLARERGTRPRHVSPKPEISGSWGWPLATSSKEPKLYLSPLYVETTRSHAEGRPSTFASPASPFHVLRLRSPERAGYRPGPRWRTSSERAGVLLTSIAPYRRDLRSCGGVLQRCSPSRLRRPRELSAVSSFGANISHTGMGREMHPSPRLILPRWIAPRRSRGHQGSLPRLALRHRQQDALLPWLQPRNPLRIRRHRHWINLRFPLSSSHVYLHRPGRDCGSSRSAEGGRGCIFGSHRWWRTCGD